MENQNIRQNINNRLTTLLKNHDFDGYLSLMIDRQLPLFEIRLWEAHEVLTFTLTHWTRYKYLFDMFFNIMSTMHNSVRPDFKMMQRHLNAYKLCRIRTSYQIKQSRVGISQDKNNPDELLYKANDSALKNEYQA